MEFVVKAGNESFVTHSRESLYEELKYLILNCKDNGGTSITITLDADASLMPNEDAPLSEPSSTNKTATARFDVIGRIIIPIEMRMKMFNTNNLYYPDGKIVELTQYEDGAVFIRPYNKNEVCKND